MAKERNVIPLVSAICILVRDIITPLGHYLSTFTLFGWPQIECLPTISWIIISVGWIAAGISAWLLREEFSQFSIVAALMFLAFGAVSFLVFWTAIGWWYWLFQATGIVAGIYFLDAART